MEESADGWSEVHLPGETVVRTCDEKEGEESSAGQSCSTEHLYWPEEGHIPEDCFALDGFLDANTESDQRKALASAGGPEPGVRNSQTD